MPTISDLRKFLVRERFAVLKGDYVGHPFHGNQYDSVGAGAHADQARNHVDTVATLKSEGRSSRGRSHGYDLDGEMAQEAMNAMDHWASAQAKSGVLRKELDDATREWQRQYNTSEDPDTWRRLQPYNTPYRDQMDAANRIAKIKDALERATAPQPKDGLSRGWYKSRTVNAEELTKVAVSALNRGFKELTGTGKSLVDKNLQPRTEPMKLVLADVNSITKSADELYKSAKDAGADPVERANAIVNLDSAARRSAQASNFVSQVYRLAGDTANAQKWEKQAGKYRELRSGIGNGTTFDFRIHDVYRAAAQQIADKTATMDDSMKMDTSKPLPPEQISKLYDLKAAYQEGIKWVNYSANGRVNSMSAPEDKELYAKLYLGTNVIDAVRRSSDASGARQALADSMSRVGKTGLEMVPNVNGYGDPQPALYVAAKNSASNYSATYRALEAESASWNAVGKQASTLSGLRGLDSPMSAPDTREAYEASGQREGAAKAALGTMKSTEGVEIGKAFSNVAETMMGEVRQHIEPGSSGDPKQYQQFLDLADSAAYSARDFLTSNEKRYDANGNYTGWETLPIKGGEDAAASAERVRWEADAFRNVVKANFYGQKGLEAARTLGPVDTTDSRLNDPASYMSRYTKATDDLRNAKDYYQTAQRTAENGSSAMDPADRKKVADIAKGQVPEIEKSLKEITDRHYQEVVGSAVANGKKAMAEAKDPNNDDARAAWGVADLQFRLALSEIGNRVALHDYGNGPTPVVTPEQRKEIDLKNEITTLFDEAQKANGRYQRENRYAL